MRKHEMDCSEKYGDDVAKDRELFKVMGQISEAYGSNAKWEQKKVLLHEVADSLENRQCLTEGISEQKGDLAQVVKDFVANTEALGYC